MDTTATATPTAATTTPALSTSTDTATTTPATAAESVATAPPTTETADPKFHKAWKGLAAAEKANVERARTIAASEKKVAQWEAALAIEDPVARVEALAELSGKKDLFDAAARAMVSRKKIDPTVSKVQSDVEILRGELTVERALPFVFQGMAPEAIAERLGIEPAALAALYADKRHQARFDAAAQHHQASIEQKLGDHATQTAAWVAAQTDADGQPTYEMIAAHDAGAKVFELIAKHHEETLAAGDPVILSQKEAADIIEAALEERSRSLLQKLQNARKMKTVAPTTADKQPVQPSPASRPASPKTLGNVASQDSSATAPPKSASDREREAIKLLDSIQAARKSR